MRQPDSHRVQTGLTRTPGRASGCSCCSLSLAGLAGLPLLAVVSLIVRKKTRTER